MKSKMRALYFEEIGPELLKGEVNEPIAEDDEVLIRVAAAGVNVHDYLDMDFDDRPFKSPYPGFECSGEVIAIGPRVSTCRKGDKVCAFTRHGGAYAEVVAVPEMFVVAVPSDIPLIDAASLPQTTCLTLWCFTVLRKITPAHKILIHGGGGGLGSIAIQYAKYIGCDVFATAGNNEKIKLCERLGAKLCINYTKEDFCERVKLETQGKGVDIILDCVGKSYLEKNVDCLSIGGSLIITGTMVFYPMITSKDEVDTMFDIDLRIIDQKKISILGASLLCVPDEVIVNMLAKAVDIVWPLVSKGDIEPVIGKVFNFSEATDALIAMVGFRFPGKVLLVP